MCGVGLLFGDGTFEDEAIVERIEKKKMKQNKIKYEKEDEEKRKFRMRKKESQHMEEGIEVVESFDQHDDDEEEETMMMEEQSKAGRSRMSSFSKRGSKSKSPRGKSKRLGRSQNDFDGGEDL